MPTRVFLARQSQGVYELRADVAATLTLPGKSVSMSSNGREWRAIDARVGGGKATFTLSAAQLGAGRVLLRTE